MNSDNHLTIVTHSNYRHWIYLLDDAFSKSKAELIVTVLDCRGIAKNDTKSFLIQNFEYMYSNNVIRQTLIELQKRNISYVKVSTTLIKLGNLKINKIFKNLFINKEKDNIERHDAIMSHLKTESGSLSFQVSKKSKNIFRKAVNEYDHGYEIYRKYIAPGNYNSVSFSHGRLPIQLGIIQGLKEGGIHFEGIQQGGTENMILKVPNGVHNQDYWRNALHDFIENEGLFPQEEYSSNPFSYHESIENKLKMEGTAVRTHLTLKPFSIFYTGYDGEDSFVINNETKTNFFPSEFDSLCCFYETTLEANIHPVIRIHPRNKKRVTELKSNQNRILEKKIKSRFPKATIITSVESDDSYEMGRQSVCSFSFHSTIGLELGYEGYSTIFTGPTYFSNIFPNNHVSNKQQMIAALKNHPIMDREKLVLLKKWEKRKGVQLQFFSHSDDECTLLEKRVSVDTPLFIKIRKIRDFLASCSNSLKI
jgi:hypothetical protein